MRFVPALAVLALSGWSPALAGTATSNMPIGVTVVASCNVNTPVALAFPNAQTLAAALDGVGEFSFTCSFSVPYFVSSSLGANANGAQRRMRDGVNYINYDLYTTAARNVPFPTVAGTVGTGTTGGTATGLPTSVMLYGRVNGGQSVPGGTYADTLVMTITW